MQKILVCDDDKQIVEAIDIYLTGEGFQVIKAYDGLEALELLKTNEVNLMIVDVMMPEMDGLEAAKAIRALDRPDAKAIPIIAMTANVFKEDREKCLAAGMNAHLSKPLDAETMKRTISEQLQKRK